jgi:hypothetical protein
MLHVKVSVGRGLVVVESQRNHLSENCVRDVLNLHITSSSFLIPFFFFFFLYLRAVVPFGLPFFIYYSIPSDDGRAEWVYS